MSPIRTCPRCGIRRQVKDGRGELCRDCWLVERSPVYTATQSVQSQDPRSRIHELLYLRRCIDAEIAATMRRIKPPGRVRDPLCGTESGYSRHRRRKQPTCDACRRAHARAEQDRAMRRALKRLKVVPQRQDDEIPAQRKAS